MKAEYLESSRQYRLANRTSVLAMMADWRRNNVDKCRSYRSGDLSKTRRENLRRKRIQLEALAHYGGACYCCGEDIPELLALDHIEGGGNRHRKEIGVAAGKLRLSAWAKRNGWPAIFRTACHTCNMGAYINGGTCPHQSLALLTDDETADFASAFAALTKGLPCT